MEKMKKLIVLLMLIAMSCNKEEVQPDFSFPITSTINSYEYDIEIIKRSDDPTSIGIFVLDADDLLPIIDEELNNINTSQSITLIGIKTKENSRVRDYTPTSIEGEESGKADDFFQFIYFDLIPELETREILDPLSQRTLIGHSIGGLATSYAFARFKYMFDNYIILSPSLFWDDFTFFEIESEYRPSVSQSTEKVFIGIGENEDLGITNGYDQFTSILENFYPTIMMRKTKAKGSHYGSRKELINEGLNYIIQ